MIKSKIKECLKYYPSYTADGIIERIRPFQYVSFDVFDTLIKRKTSDPTDVFSQAAYHFNLEFPDMLVDIEAFKKNRVEAERKARETKKNEEVVLSDIYEKLPLEYSSVAMQLMIFEVAAEMDLCYANCAIQDVYKWCVQNGKKVIIISDIYLERSVIEDMLRKCGYSNWSAIFVSSEIGVQKNTGEIYNYVCDRTGCFPKDIIHVGDNIKSDYLMAKLNHFHCAPIANENRCTSFLVRKSRSDEQKAIRTILNNSVGKCSNRYYQYGYEIFGPLLYGFTIWLNEELCKQEIDKVFFLSRDGYIMMKNYLSLYNSKDNVQYMYVSRKALQVPQIWLTPNIEHFSSDYMKSKHWTCKKISKRLGLRYSYTLEKWQLAGFSEKEEIRNVELENNPKFRSFWDSIKEVLIQQSKIQYEYLIDYLKQIGFAGNVAIVDIGWHGTMQRHLEKIVRNGGIEASIHGFYLGLDNALSDDSNMSAYLPKEVNATNGMMGLLEVLFPSLEGSTEGYEKKSSGQIVPVLGESEYETENDKFILRQFQEGALDFTVSYRDCFFLRQYKPYAFYQGIETVGRNPTKPIADFLGDIPFMDDSRQYLAAPKALTTYVLHPKSFKEDFLNSPWKIGFLKRLFILNLPYDRIFDILKSVSSKGGTQ